MRPSLRPLAGKISVPVFVGCVLLIFLVGASFQGFRLYRLSVYNRMLHDIARVELNESSPGEIIFAKARYLDRQGNYQEALRLYNSIENKGDAAFQQRVRYNMATIYLREAAKHWNAQGVWAYAQVNTLLELAKHRYRQVLRMDPGNFDARFNLEYAYRITPPPKEKDKADWRGSKSSVFATLPGIPGGGP
jgi:mxaK protein